ncbi:hypothetical protein [Hoeflea sp. AS16]|uniref:hypothetical protein n=1 Tax=Hoeflea sp. AS16 TaxID=3135779 RepID=UPI0031815D43
MSSVFPVPPSWSPEMTTILAFDQSRCRKANAATSSVNAPGKTAEVIMFTGIRREPLYASTGLPVPVMHEPMFDDSAPDKPTGRKRRRGKNA